MTSYRIESDENGKCNTCGEDWEEGHGTEIHYEDAD